ncbi:MAG: large subunit ribosomal protein [Patescibacteria group bacterium]|nr:large subunit ribosomal protein [Euryarchaeota archaeon]MDQ1282171.1 large subunit ribosomal protein [Patescibacteria group bacterium]
MTKEKKEKEITEQVSKTENFLIISPRLTEKASVLSSGNIYTFNVVQNATKTTLAKEIEKKYKVKPIKITVSNNPRVRVFTRGKIGYKTGFKKASVFLKKGDKLNLA